MPGAASHVALYIIYLESFTEKLPNYSISALESHIKPVIVTMSSHVKMISFHLGKTGYKYYAPDNQNILFILMILWIC